MHPSAPFGTSLHQRHSQGVMDAQKELRSTSKQVKFINRNSEMALFSEQELTIQKDHHVLRKALSERIVKAEIAIMRKERYDVFLSHRHADAAIIEAVAREIESRGLSVFVDWIENPNFDKSNVNSETAAFLRDAIRSSQCLVYTASENSGDSVWMPWELGYADGLHGRVAILPITKKQNQSNLYTGREYLGLYPYITHSSDKNGNPQLWVRSDAKTYTAIGRWLNGNMPYIHH